FKKVIEDTLGTGSVDMPAMGSGGGVAWAFYMFFRASISKSMDFILETIDFEDLIKDKDVFILGENVDQFDGSASLNMASLAKRYKKDIKIIDRKSTRLNSSHVSISYAVFCLKKKK